METIKQLIDFLLNDNGLTKINELLAAFYDKRIDLRYMLSKLTPELISSFAGVFSNAEKNREKSLSAYGTEPIKGVASAAVLDSLNSFLS